MSKVLLGMHNPKLLRDYQKYFERRGYGVEVHDTLEGMLTCATREPYSVYFMDINLGLPNTSNTSPAEKIYAAMQQHSREGEAHFLAFSSNAQAVASAKEKKIPAISKSDFNSLLEFLGKIKNRE